MNDINSKLSAVAIAIAATTYHALVRRPFEIGRDVDVEKGARTEVERNSKGARNGFLGQHAVYIRNSGRWQCQICQRSSGRPLKGVCTGDAQAKRHMAWRVGDITFCVRCGAYARCEVRLLAEMCEGGHPTVAMEGAREG